MKSNLTLFAATVISAILITPAHAAAGLGEHASVGATHIYLSYPAASGAMLGRVQNFLLRTAAGQRLVSLNPELGNIERFQADSETHLRLLGLWTARLSADFENHPDAVSHELRASRLFAKRFIQAESLEAAASFRARRLDKAQLADKARELDVALLYGEDTKAAVTALHAIAEASSISKARTLAFRLQQDIAQPENGTSRFPFPSEAEHENAVVDAIRSAPAGSANIHHHNPVSLTAYSPKVQEALQDAAARGVQISGIPSRTYWNVPPSIKEIGVKVFETNPGFAVRRLDAAPQRPKEALSPEVAAALESARTRVGPLPEEVAIDFRPHYWEDNPLVVIKLNGHRIYGEYLYHAEANLAKKRFHWMNPLTWPAILSVPFKPSADISKRFEAALLYAKEYARREHLNRAMVASDYVTSPLARAFYLAFAIAIAPMRLILGGIVLIGKAFQHDSFIGSAVTVLLTLVGGIVAYYIGVNPHSPIAKLIAVYVVANMIMGSYDWATRDK